MENFQDLFEEDYNLLVWKDSLFEDILIYAPKDTYTWKVYNKLFLEGTPKEDDLYIRRLPEAIKRVLSENIILMDTLESVYETVEFQTCSIVRLRGQPLPVHPMSIPFKKGYRKQELLQLINKRFLCRKSFSGDFQ